MSLEGFWDHQVVDHDDDVRPAKAERFGWHSTSGNGSPKYLEDEPVDAATTQISEPDPDELLHVELTTEERRMLAIGLGDWGGPAYGSEPLAQAMGFESLEGLYDESQLLCHALLASTPLSRRDWTRAIVATEIAFVSALGTGCGSWEAIHGGRAEKWFAVLLRLQAKVRVDLDLLPD